MQRGTYKGTESALWKINIYVLKISFVQATKALVTTLLLCNHDKTGDSVVAR